MKKYYLKPIKTDRKTYQVNHKFSDCDILRIFLMPRVGVKVSFSEAYLLRRYESMKNGFVVKSFINTMDLVEYCISRCIYIEFEDKEIEINTCEKLQH